MIGAATEKRQSSLLEKRADGEIYRYIDPARKFLEKEESVKRARNILEGDASYDEDLWCYLTDNASKKNPAMT